MVDTRLVDKTVLDLIANTPTELDIISKDNPKNR